MDELPCMKTLRGLIKTIILKKIFRLTTANNFDAQSFQLSIILKQVFTNKYLNLNSNKQRRQ